MDDHTTSWGIEPVPERLRVLGLVDQALLWGSLGVSLLVIVVGALLVPALSLKDALLALVLGAVGYGVAVMFVLQGGPDLALTQFLVETLTLVLFVFVLRRLPSSFTPRRLMSQAARIGIAAAVGVVVTAAVLVARQARTAPPASQAYLDQALPEGGGSNVVNVVLVDFRGFDTLGEITVLAVAALGIGSLVAAGRRRPERTSVPVADPADPSGASDGPAAAQVHR